MSISHLPAKEYITDANGRIIKVVLDWEEYKKMIAILEDEGLYRAMMEVKDEVPLRVEEASLELGHTTRCPVSYQSTDRDACPTRVDPHPNLPTDRGRRTLSQGFPVNGRPMGDV